MSLIHCRGNDPISKVEVAIFLSFQQLVLQKNLLLECEEEYSHPSLKKAIEHIRHAMASLKEIK